MVTTREVSVEDAKTVAGLVAALLAELGPGERGAGVDTRLVGDLLAMKERVCGFLAFDLENPVGLIMLSEGAALLACGIYGIVTELYVVPDQRSSGVAMRLIDAAVDLGKEKGWRHLEVGVPRQPMWSRSPHSALYLKAGFAEIGPRLRLPLHSPSRALVEAERPRLGRRRRRVHRGPTSSAAHFA